MENLKGHTLLLVDDEQDILDFLSYNLKKEGFQVYTALNGRDAINIAKKEICIFQSKQDACSNPSCNN